MALPATIELLTEQDKLILRTRLRKSLRQRAILFIFAAVCLAGVFLWMAPDLNGKAISPADWAVASLIVLVLVSPSWFPWLELQWRIRNGRKAILNIRIAEKEVFAETDGPSYRLETDPDIELPMFIFAAIAPKVEVDQTVEISFLEGTDELISIQVQGVEMMKE